MEIETKNERIIKEISAKDGDLFIYGDRTEKNGVLNALNLTVKNKETYIGSVNYNYQDENQVSVCFNCSKGNIDTMYSVLTSIIKS